jgi:hypothetical protein
MEGTGLEGQNFALKVVEPQEEEEEDYLLPIRLEHHICLTNSKAGCGSNEKQSITLTLPLTFLLQLLLPLRIRRIF